MTEEERKLEGVDRVTKHEWFQGFDKSLCKDCEYLITNSMGAKKCKLCGCFIAGLALAKAPPETCPYQ